MLCIPAIGEPSNQSLINKTQGNCGIFRMVIICLSFLLAGGFGGCSKKSSADSAASAQRGIPVTVAKVVSKSVPVNVEAIGTVEAYSTVSVKSMVTGEITRVNFVQGQDVKKGDLLFAIDARPYEAALQQAQANLARDLAQEKNALEQAKRYTTLYEQGVSTKEQADQYQSTASALQAAVRADQAAVENARVQLSYCSIFSPIDGRTGSLLIHQGNLIKANDTPIMVVINQITPIYVDFSVPEQTLPEVKKYMTSARLKVTAVIPQEGGGPEEGILTFVDNTVDASTGTIVLKGTFDNPRRRLWPGQFVNVTLTLGTEADRVVVPSEAIQTTQGGQFVFVVKPDLSVESRAVVVKRAVQGVSVVDQGLQPGEVVVTDGQLRLLPGSKVEFKNAI